MSPGGAGAPIRRGPFESTQFLLIRSRSTRSEIENDEGEAVLLVSGPRRPRRLSKKILGGALAAAIALVLGGWAWNAAGGRARVIYVVALPLAARLLLVPRRPRAIYAAESRERLVELHPARLSWRAIHHLVDAEGRLIARFELAWLHARWIARDATGQVICRAAMRPRLRAIALLGRGTFLRMVILSVDPAEPYVGLISRRSRDFDGHDLLDLTRDPTGILDRRVAVALAILIA